MSKITTVWDFDLLWPKCKLYAAKALAELRESEMFPFWCALTLEFLGRATLSKIHPVLIADPREGDNILYVFGFSTTEGPPKSIVAKTVFDRCTKIVPDFTKKELDSCLKLIEKRNEELHSGSAAFAEFPTKLWLADYYRSCKILLAFMGLSLEDLFGKDEEKGAEEMIKEVDAKEIKEVHARIEAFSKYFTHLSEEEKEKKAQSGLEKAIENLKSGIKMEKCICCKSQGLVSGKAVSVSQEKLEGVDIVYERIILPTSFNCFSCGFKLSGHQELIIAGYGGQFTEKITWDPAEYYGIDTREPDFDYGND